MQVLAALSNILWIIFILGSFTTIGMVFYLGKRHVKEIDRVVYGHEFPNDSIFALLVRIPNYAGAFTFQWSAKRSRLADKIEQFDNSFRKPFIITYWLMIVSAGALLLGILIEKLFLGL